MSRVIMFDLNKVIVRWSADSLQHHLGERVEHSALPVSVVLSHVLGLAAARLCSQTLDLGEQRTDG